MATSRLRNARRALVLRVGLLVVVALLVASCGGSSEDATTTATPAEPTSAPSFEPTATSVDPAPTAVDPAPTSVDPAPTAIDPAPTSDAVLDPTWLRVNGMGDHDFGTAQAEVLATVESVFGPPESVGVAGECGAGPMVIASFDDFTVQFQDDEFIGWYYASSTPPLSTPSGVAPGISEADLRVVYDGVEIRDDSLGREFLFEVPAGFMAGFISDTDESVTALYAGINCFFR